MGQCYGKIKRKRLQRRRQFRHKRFDFTPKRLWKYRDAHMLNEFPDMGGQADGDVADVIIENEMVEDSEEEVDTGEVRQSGRLVFSEEEEEEEEEEEGLGEGGGGTEVIVNDSHLQVRERTLSGGSEQIGRFEVMDVETPPPSASRTESDESSSSESSSGDGSAKGEVLEPQVISEKDMAYLIENEAVS